MEKETVQPRPVTETVRALRRALGDTQQAFAHRLGLAISTVVRYESTRPPRGAALSHLARVADEAGRADLATELRGALWTQIGERTPGLSQEEDTWASLLLAFMRNRDVPAMQHAWTEIRQMLLNKTFAVIAEAETGQDADLKEAVSGMSGLSIAACGWEKHENERDTTAPTKGNK